MDADLHRDRWLCSQDDVGTGADVVTEHQLVYQVDDPRTITVDSSPPADGKEHTAFPGHTRQMIVDWFVGGKSIDYLARWFHCEHADIEHVLRVAMEVST